MTGPVRCEVSVDAPRETVFEMFTDPELLVRWIGISAWLEPRPDGLFRFEVAPGEVCSGRYVEVDPPRRVTFTWGWESGAIPVEPGSTLVEVELEDEGDGRTRVVLTHSGLEGEQADLHADGWERFLDRLGAVVEGRDPGPEPATTRTLDEAREDVRRGREGSS